jgi:hypothetical protein
MPVVIEEVTAEALKPVAPERTNQPVTEVPADTTTELRKTLAAIRRAEARAERLRAD